MGEILTEIRDELRNFPSQAPTPQSTTSENNQQPSTIAQSVTIPSQTADSIGVNTENATGTSTGRNNEPNFPNMEH